jgi:hypothetical protein
MEILIYTKSKEGREEPHHDLLILQNVVEILKSQLYSPYVRIRERGLSSGALNFPKECAGVKH